MRSMLSRFLLLIGVLLSVCQLSLGQSTSLLRVSGTVYEQGQPSQTEMTVTVANLDRPQIKPAVTSLGRAGVGGYDVLFIDIFGNQVMGAAGDHLELSLTDPDTGDTIKVVDHVILSSEIDPDLGDVIIDVYLTVASALVFVPVPEQQIKPDDLLSFQLQLTEAIPGVQFGMTAAPQGAAIDPATGTFSWIPLESQVGSYEIQFTAEGDGRTGQTSVSIQVIPKFPTTTLLVIEGTAFDAPGQPTTQAVTIYVENLDRSNVNSSSVVGTVGPGMFSVLLFEPITGRVLGQSGEVLEIRAVLPDGEVLVQVLHELTDEDIVTNSGFIVKDLMLNRPPVMESISSRTLRVGQDFVLEIVAEDPDGDALRYLGVGLPQGAQLDTAEGRFYWRPQNEGTFSIVFAVTDGKDGYAEQQVTFTVQPNTAPMFQPILVPPLVEFNVPVQIKVQADDPEGDPVSYAILGAPIGADFDAEQGVFSWTPTEDTIGQTYDLVFGATDPFGAASTLTLPVTVLASPAYEVELVVVEPAQLTIEQYLGSAGYLIQITNRGNRADSFQFSHDADQTFTAVLEPSQVTLESGQSADIGLLLRSQEDTEPGEYITQVTAVSDTDPEAQAQTQVTTTTLAHAILAISSDSIVFDAVTHEQIWSIQNTGNGTLGWHLENLPEWLVPSQTEGETPDQTDLVLTVDRTVLEPGEYATTFQVKDANDSTLAVNVRVTVPEPRDATLRLQPATQTVKVNTRVTLHLMLEADVAIPHVELAFAFDPSILQFVEFSHESDQVQWQRGLISNEVGQTTRPFEISRVDGADLGTLDLQLHFDVVGAGSTAITMLRLALRAEDGRTDFRIAKIPAKVESLMPTAPWDVNGDGTTNITDLVIVGQHFGETPAEIGDVNNDGTVNILDLVTIGAHFGEDSEVFVAPGSLTPRLAGQEGIALEWRIQERPERLSAELVANAPIDLAGWSATVIGQEATGLEALNIGRDWAHTSVFSLPTSGQTTAAQRLTSVRLGPHPAMFEGVLLEVELSPNAAKLPAIGVELVDSRGASWYWRDAGRLIPPTQPVLGTNFPNPFNPETWIPFQIDQSSDVVLRVFDMQGHLVRTLDLGWLPAGRYESRSTAAHWDGRSDTGESLASGVYYYQLQAGQFTAMQKCILRK